MFAAKLSLRMHHAHLTNFTAYRSISQEIDITQPRGCELNDQTPSCFIYALKRSRNIFCEQELDELLGGCMMQCINTFCVLQRKAPENQRRDNGNTPDCMGLLAI